MQESVAPRVRLLLISAALVAAILICYWTTNSFEFTNWDDHRYVTRNPMVLDGLTVEGVKWAFTTFEMGNWHPLTWLSHMVDSTLFRDEQSNPLSGPPHLINVAIHCFNSLVILLILQRMTGSLWRSALAAALFALHPLRVESVAWVSERKDVLCACFGLLSIWFYIGYVIDRQTARTRVQDYVLALLSFALCLMCKPMLVTLPFVLLLLDYWPLRRLTRATIPGLIIEKLPFLAMTIVACIVAVIAQHHSGAVSSFGEVPLGLRTANAITAYAIYVRQMFWPVDLGPLYPLRRSLPLWQVGLSGAILLGITVVAFINRKRKPHLLTGWLWYMGTLVPVIGLVQIGSQAHADRYTYVPMIGLLVAIIWSIPASWAEHKPIPAWLAGSSLLLVAALAAQTSIQVRYWRNSITVAQRALDVTRNNAVAHFNLGLAYSERGDFDRAATQFSRAAEISPNWAAVHYNLGNLLRRTGHLDEAVNSYLIALECEASYVDAYINLGTTLAALHKIDDAIAALQTAVKIDDRSAQAHLNLAVALAEANRLDEAIVHYRRSLELDPSNALADLNLGSLFGRQGKIELALFHFQKALQHDPSNIQARVSCATALKDLGQVDQAIQHLRIAAERARATEQWTLNQQIQERIEQYQQLR